MRSLTGGIDRGELKYMLPQGFTIKEIRDDVIETYTDLGIRLDWFSIALGFLLALFIIGLFN